MPDFGCLHASVFAAIGAEEESRRNFGAAMRAFAQAEPFVLGGIAAVENLLVLLAFSPIPELFGAVDRQRMRQPQLEEELVELIEHVVVEIFVLAALLQELLYIELIVYCL